MRAILAKDNDLIYKVLPITKPITPEPRIYIKEEVGMNLKSAIFAEKSIAISKKSQAAIFRKALRDKGWNLAVNGFRIILPPPQERAAPKAQSSPIINKGI
jgi:hypothetical protein